MSINSSTYTTNERIGTLEHAGADDKLFVNPLIGDQTTGPSVDFNQADISIADVRWMKLDVERVVTTGNWIEKPNLTKVDEVGFADLMPGSGHGAGGYVNVGKIEVFGKPVKR